MPINIKQKFLIMDDLKFISKKASTIFLFSPQYKRFLEIDKENSIYSLFFTSYILG